MIVVPKDKPVFEGLHTSYLHMEKLLEHFQGSIGSGAIVLHSQDMEGVVFFDSDVILSGILKAEGEELKGQEAIDRILELARQRDFSVSIYAIDAYRIVYWANIPFSRPIYTDLSSEFTDLDGLVQKQRTEGLTGYISAVISGSGEEGLLFFSAGELIGGVYSWASNGLDESRQGLEQLFDKVMEKGAVFNVNKIEPHSEQRQEEVIREAETVDSGEIHAMLEELLTGLERAIEKERRIDEHFSTILRRKFLEKAEEYPFLDPFAAEMEYRDGKLYNYGETSEEEVAKGVGSVAQEIIQEQGLKKRMDKELEDWRSRYSDQIAHLGLDV